MEGLENRLSQPVAFASVPLEFSQAVAPGQKGQGQQDSSATSGSESEVDPSTPASAPSTSAGNRAGKPSSKASKGSKSNIGKASSSSWLLKYENMMMADYASQSPIISASLASTISHSQFPPPRLQPHTIDLVAEMDEVLADDCKYAHHLISKSCIMDAGSCSCAVDDLSESFCLIPSAANGRPAPGTSSMLLASVAGIGTSPKATRTMAGSKVIISAGGSTGTTLQTLERENASLKAALDGATKQLAQQDAVLRSRANQDRELKASIVLAKQEVLHLIHFAPSLLDLLSSSLLSSPITPWQFP
jgi:hypothetical protein